MFLITLLACTEPDETPAPAKVEPPPEMEIEVVPAQVDFGTQGFGAPAVQVVSIHNIGEAAVTLSALYADSDAVALDAVVNAPIAPGASEDVTVTWSPGGPASLSDQMGLLMRTPSGELQEVPVPLTGTAAGPVVTLTSTNVDFGTVSVGCTATATVTIGNTGTAPLVIDSVGLAELSDLVLTGADGELPALPWTLAPYDNVAIELVYAPTDEGSLTDILEIHSDDPVTPLAEVVLGATARVEEANSITYDVGPTQNITALFAMNPVAVRDPRLEDGLPIFFDAMLASRVHYRVAFLYTTDGEVDGSVPYIDETMTSDEAVTTALAMVEPAEFDNDALLQTLQFGIEQNGDWLFDGGDWEDSRLSLIGMNSDTEQSSGNATVYVNEYLTYKDDPADILVHAISGDVPRGCSVGSAFAEPAELLYNAANETSGTFLSWCADWTTNFTTLAEAVIGEVQHFSLTGDPAAWSIEVRVNGTRLDGGWSYDADAMEIVFEDEVYPAYGAEVRIDYIMTAECE